MSESESNTAVLENPTSQGQAMAAAATPSTRSPRGEKKEAVQRAMAELGEGATPNAISEHLAKQGFTVTPAHVSNIKSGLKKEAAGGSSKPRGSKGKATFTADDIKALKAVVQRLGGEKVKEMVDTLASFVEKFGAEQTKSMVDALA